MDLIMAVDKEWNIGNDGKLLAHLPGDLQRFKNITSGHMVVMGRKTFESLPNGPLPNRFNVVITSHPEELPQGVFSYPSVEDFLEDLQQFFVNNFSVGWFPNVYVIGGGQLAEALLPYCNQAFITQIDHIFEADTKMPNLDEDPNWTKILESETFEENGYSYKFLLYTKA